MFIIKLKEDEYLVSQGRIRLWEDITDPNVAAYMSFYDSGFKTTKVLTEATVFTDQAEAEPVLNNKALQILYPDAKLETK